MFSVFPINICTTSDNNVHTWQNTVFGSTRFCRPAKFMFKQIESVKDFLVPSTTVVDEIEISIRHDLIMTIIHAKFATPWLVPSQVKLDTAENCRYILSTLHAWIHQFGLFHQLAERLMTVEKKMLKGANPTKKMVTLRKQKFQKEFKNLLGLNI